MLKGLSNGKRSKTMSILEIMQILKMFKNVAVLNFIWKTTRYVEHNNQTYRDSIF